MTRILQLPLLGVVVVTTVGCATMVHGTRRDVRFESFPPEATAQAGSQTVTTPGVLQLSRGTSYEVEFRKPGYMPAHAHIANVAGGAIWGNILLGGVIGICVDFADGAAYNLEPATVQATLVADPAAAPAAAVSSILRSPRPRREPSDAHPCHRETLEGALEPCLELLGHVDPIGPLGRRLQAPAPRGQTDAPNGPAVAVRRLPVETVALEIRDLRTQPREERGPLPVDGGVPRAGARDQRTGRIARQHEGRDEEIEPRGDAESSGHEPAHQHLGRVERQVMGTVRLGGPPHHQDAMAPRHP